MDETIYVILKLLLDFALEVWFSICDAFCDFGACGGTTSSAENATLNDVNKF